MAHDLPDFETFKKLAAQGNLAPLYRRIYSDRITPVVAYRRLVHGDERTAPSFLLESVVGGDRQARYSFLGAQPIAQIIARGNDVKRIVGDEVTEYTCDDPMAEPAKFIEDWKIIEAPELPTFTGGWVGYASYDTVRYAEGEKLPDPPADDRNLPDMHFGLYKEVVAFDNVAKTILAITHVLLDEYDSVEAAYEAGCGQLDALVNRLETETSSMTGSDVPLDLPASPLAQSNMTAEAFGEMVEKSKEYISAGDIFQVVLAQRFERETSADPFDIYRALRVVNPSPYMFYLQAEGCMLVGASPEIICRVQEGVVTSRPLAGTRKRGATLEEDLALEEDLLADPKERAEHIMLVDLGRNDVGKVSEQASVHLPKLMVVERYSHVMHISSTVTGRIKEGLSSWDVLRATLPVGTVSGAPKVRAMQIIDELEPTRRGPYAGAVGYADFAGNMDMAIALRTMVVMPGASDGTWKVHLQAGAGIVADSVAENEFQETVNKSAAMAKAIDLAEASFG
jgi:anthranilate synthase component 1